MPAVTCRCGAPQSEDLAFAETLIAYGVVRQRLVCSMGHTTYVPPAPIASSADEVCPSHYKPRPCKACALASYRQTLAKRGKRTYHRDPASFEPKPCIDCDRMYQPHAPNQRKCDACTGPAGLARRAKRLGLV